MEDLKKARRDSAGVVEAENRLLMAEARFDDFQRSLEARFSLTGLHPSLEEVQAALDSSTAILGWADAAFSHLDQRFLWAYLVRRSGEVEWVRLRSADQAALCKRLAAFKERMIAAAASPLGARRDTALEGEASRLGTEFLGSVLERLDGIQNLMIVPSASTSAMPLESLRDSGGRLLGERFAVSHAPSSMAHAWMVKRRRPGASGAALLVGDPPFRPEHLRARRTEASQTGSIADASVLRDALGADRAALARLPRLGWSRREVELVARAFPRSEVLIGAEATEGRLRDLASAARLRDFRVVHLATHALIDMNAPLGSALVLSQLSPSHSEGEGDGLLTGLEIATTWSLDAELVTLSSCETALGRQGIDGGTIGFAQSFFGTGARCLMLSLWKVDDEAIALLMGRFYENWRGTYRGKRAGRGAGAMSKAEALQEAKRWLRQLEDRWGRRRFEHPYYWSAFILVGDAA